MWIDSHFHLSAVKSSLYGEVLSKPALYSIAGGLVVSTQQKDWLPCIALSEQLGTGFHAAIGVHPWWVTSVVDWSLATQLLSTYTQLALGEIGLDGHYAHREQQQALFQYQLRLAQTFSRPVSLHLVKDAEEGYRMIKHAFTGTRGIVHAFSGSLQQALNWQALGFYVGIGPRFLHRLTTKKAQLLRQLDIRLVLLETDAPTHFANQSITQPTQLLGYGMQLAEILQLEVAELQRQLCHNWDRLWSHTHG